MTKQVKENTMSRKKNDIDELDDETLALLAWCTEVEAHLVAAGASEAEAQDHIEEQAEWYTDMFYDGLSPAEAAKQALA
ncbi:hypothetical protein [Vogesella sp. XCS3]|uniref:hypothetical protein n=1 Tax=Vogesella sp. XCS3 TaxID=2877939 RepID=UPI001D0A97B9|nr:hypothetical protein [Vogesella sp. XCS3]UDM17831.1 hypothetical protein LCH97_03975 [Vogesella sp. XCS3]